MDQLLKARKLSSASARRKRIQQQQDDEIAAQEKYREHKRRILYDDLFVQEEEEDEEGGEGEDYSDEDNQQLSRDTVSMESSQHEHDDSVQTPSERSVTTPQDTPFTQVMFENADEVHVDISIIPAKPELQILVPDTPHDVDEPSTIGPPSPQPKMLASLAAPADWQYDRFSMIIADSPLICQSPQESSSVPEVLDVDEDDSPLETAKPISYSMPKMRPSVISIISTTSIKKRRTASIQSPLSQESSSTSREPPQPPPRSEKRLSVVSTRSGFQACEASPMELPNLPNNAMYLISNASKDSLGQFPAPAGVQRKSSAPLLSAIKTSHARMSSIKNLIKTPTHARAPSIISASRPESRSSSGRPSTAAADILNDNYNPFETMPAGLNQPPPRSSFRPRPKSSHRPSTSGMSSISANSVTALPTPPANDTRPDAVAEEHAGSMRRKKSFSSLRKRSESIGQAIKFAALKSKPTPRYEESPPPPPVPVLITPNLPPMPHPTIRSYTSPPVPSPRSRKSTASYSMFPPSPRVGGPVGLGLKV